MPLFLSGDSHYSHRISLLEYLPRRLLQWLIEGRTSWFFSLLFGALIPLSFAPFNNFSAVFSLLIFLPLSLFLYQLIQTRTAREAFYKGLFFGVGLFGVGVSWLYVAIHDFGAAHWSLAVFFTGGFVLLLSLFYALFGWSLFKIRNKCSMQTSSRQIIVLLFYLPILWVFFEWLRSWLLTGFPWLLLGYPLIETSLANYAPIIGIYGLSLLVTFMNNLGVVSYYAHTKNVNWDSTMP